MNDVTEADLVEATLAIIPMFSEDEDVKFGQLFFDRDEIDIGLVMLKEAEDHLLDTFGERAEHDGKVHDVLYLLRAAVKLLDDEVAAKNKALGEIMKIVIERTLDARSVKAGGTIK